MADYYPLIARAVAGLDPGATGETRRALYERARTALIAQLRSVDPPLSEADITRERLALEDAVRRVEAEAAQRARTEPPRPRAEGAAGAPRREGPRPGDALRESARAARATSPSPSASASRPTPPRPDTPPAPAATPPAAESRPPRPVRPETPPSRGEARAVPPRSPEEPHRSLEDMRAPSAGPGVRGLRDVVADVDDLGQATSQAGRAARRAYFNVPPSDDENRPPAEPAEAEPPYSYDESAEEAGRYQPRPRGRDSEATRRPVVRQFPVKGAMAAGAALVVIGLAVWLGPKMLAAFRSTPKPAEVAETQKDAGTRPKISDRVGQQGGGQQIAPVAQRVVLYDEDPSSPQGKQYVGSVIWRTEPVKGAAGQPADVGIRADIEIPERKMKMSLSIRRNTDASLPASHTAELTFTLPPDFGATVANVPGILMKSNEQARGTPLAGLAVKVTDGFFLVGLSNVEADRSRNLQLLKERSWFDIPVVYSNQRRAIIAVEKGAPGERAFNEAFTAWGQ